MDSKLILFSSNDKIKKSELFEDKYKIEKDINFLKTEKIIKENWILGFHYQESSFHHKFKTIISPPKIIYYKWNIQILDKDILWIVWPRMVSDYWKDVIQELFSKITNFNLVTISWLAEWVDDLAHNLSIQNWIATIAVLWWWILHYFKNKSKIINNILGNNWLVISEYPIYLTPQNYTFPQRNRIIAGLSKAIFIPEAWKKSWSLITANFANQMNKPVYWTPNNIFSPNSFWIHEEIAKNKIKLCTNAKNFLYTNFHPIYNCQRENINLNTQEKQIIEILTNNELTLEEIIEKTQTPTSLTISTLNILEINWLIKQTWVWRYKVKP